MGEAKASAPAGSRGSQTGADAEPTKRNLRARAWIAGGLLLAACQAPPARPRAEATAITERPAHVATPPSLAPSVASIFVQGVLAEAIEPATTRAHALWSQAADGAPSRSQTLAALRAAEVAAIDGRANEARQQMLRVTASTFDDPAWRERRRDVELLLGGQDSPGLIVHGPPIETALPGPAISAATARAWATLEARVARVHGLKIRPAFETVLSSLRIKVGATEQLVRDLRAFAEAEPAARGAAVARTAGLWHGLAIATSVEPPAELDPSVAARLRRTLQAHTKDGLRQAIQGYQRSLELLPADASTWRGPIADELAAARAVEVR